MNLDYDPLQHDHDHDHDHREQDIERVLFALRDTVPPAAMERRILDALAARQRTAPAGGLPGWRRSLGLAQVSAWSWAMATAGLAVVLFVSLSMARRFRVVAPEVRVGSASAVAPVAVAVSAARAQPVGRLAVAVATQRPHGHAVRDAAAPVRESPAAEPTAATCHCDPVALAETLAPSRPAPPLPLTTQEKMLLRLVSRGDRVELAELDPNLRARSNARERAQFQQFFAPPTPGDKE